ncbi:FISUMP domain-containing protein [Fibrobacter sp. UWH4]|uniref:FISUMP domain-containing protein n=1 Tax=Fibrobacter sp. UWH4 TaxID=1896210 RepID=UPI000910085B|nr:FISUMP domain-containing protein [Fibrobacter sp. UWH4]SHK64223.1 major paralogous domain-containing protein [Fibrobacter sp. UWH4]
MKIFTNVIASPVRAKQSIFGRLVFALVFACIFIACGDESGSSAPDSVGEISLSSNEDLGSSSSVGENGWENGSSSSLKPDSNGSQKNSSSAITVQSSSSSNAKSSSSKAWTCSEEGKIVEKKNKTTDVWEIYQCVNGVYELVVYSSSSEKVYTFKELFKEDSVFNKKMEYGTFEDPRDGQKYRTIVIKTGYVSVPEFEAFAQNLNYGSQIKLGTSVFDDDKVEKYCYDDDPWFCEHYFGGLYSWSEAMGLPKACDSVWTGTTQNCPDSIAPGIVYEAEWSDLQIQGICPEGWHVMNETEWRALIHGDESASRAISKASYGGNESGFSALRGGGKLVSHPELNAVYEDIGDACNYWLPSEESEGGANGLVDYRYSYFMYDRIHDKNFGLPVRCVKNYLSESR